MLCVAVFADDSVYVCACVRFCVSQASPATTPDGTVVYVGGDGKVRAMQFGDVNDSDGSDMLLSDDSGACDDSDNYETGDYDADLARIVINLKGSSAYAARVTRVACLNDPDTMHGELFDWNATRTTLQAVDSSVGSAIDRVLAYLLAEWSKTSSVANKWSLGQ